jgi:hypothetical protein
MSTILNTNAPLITAPNGDLSGYALPASDPVDIDTKWITKCGREDELVYVVTWADGTWADMFSLPNEWNRIFWNCSKARYEASAAKLDATLAALGAARVEDVREVEVA